MFNAIYGRCECGTVRYRVDAPAQELYHCHCSRCRRIYGALFATYAVLPRDQMTFEKGYDELSVYRSRLATWRFCRNCGCHLVAEQDHHPDTIWYMPATLEGDAVPAHPSETEKHIYVGSKSPIEKISKGIPQFEGSPEENERLDKI